MSLRSKDVVGLACVALVLLVAVPAFTFLGTSTPPPALGSLAYNGLALPLTPGASYVDPVFGSTVRRVTTDHGLDDIYARNMWWNADETRYLHRTTNGTPWPDFWEVIEVATGKVTHRGLPIGGVVGGAGPFAAGGGF